MDRIRMATVWLEGCSGCHMSFLDMDEWLLELPGQVELVYSPLVDQKTFPSQVDVTLVEGGVGNQEQWEMIHRIRDRTAVLIAFGDCAITSNVPGMRNSFGTAEAVLQRSYLEGVQGPDEIPDRGDILPDLLDQVKPIHTVVPVDFFLPGCPPPANRIRTILETILQGDPAPLQGEDLKFG